MVINCPTLRLCETTLGGIRSVKSKAADSNRQASKPIAQWRNAKVRSNAYQDAHVTHCTLFDAPEAPSLGYGRRELLHL